MSDGDNMHTLFAYLRDRWPLRHRLSLPPQAIQRCLTQAKAEPWHGYALQKRMWRRHVCIATGWLAEMLPAQATIFEPGCGSGANLLWLAQQGFTHLSGADISPSALTLCRLLAQASGQPISTWQDDCLHPHNMPQQPFDAMLSVNWLYHVPGSSLEGFLATYRPWLRPRGMLFCDCINASFNSVRNNQFHTSDTALPPEQRRPSEYTFRLSVPQVRALARQQGFAVLRTTRTHSCPQRDVYALQRLE